MNAFKRAMTNIKRQPVKNGVLSFLILILATALSGAISVRQAINNTEESIMLRTPAVATFSLNVYAVAEETDTPQMQLGSDHWRTNRPTLEDISAIGNLPYVRMYDAVMLPHFYSRDLEWGKLEIDEQRLPPGVSISNMESVVGGISGFRGDDFSYMELFLGRGVANPNMVDIDAGLIDLIIGRTFTEEEISNAEQVIIVSQAFAAANDLSVGSIVEFENNVYNFALHAKEENEGLTTHWDDRFIAAHQVLEFEIVGIYDTDREFNYEDYDDRLIEVSLIDEARLQNRIYMPITVAEDILRFENEGNLLLTDDIIEFFGEDMAAEFSQGEPWIESIFVLYDPRDIDTFQEAGSALLPGFWEINSLRDVNASLISSMDSVRELADWILITSVCATIAVLTLIITLLLRDRRHEIGVYMALGEKKSSVIFQFLTEIILVSSIAIIIALFIGNGASATISRNLLEQHLVDNVQQDQIIFGDGALPPELMHFNLGELSIAETLEMYDTSLNTATILTFVGVGAVVILLSTAIPIAYVVKLEPKKVLTG